MTSFLGRWFKSSKAYWPTPTRWATLASFPFIPIVIGFHILLLLLTRYIAWPENLLWPYLRLHGLVLYKNIFYIYPPLYAEIVTVFTKIFGVSLFSIQLISYINIALTDILLYFVGGKRLPIVLIYIPLQLFFEGGGFWPDQLLTTFFLASYLCFKNRRGFLMGIFIALSLFTKQTASYFVIGLGLLSIFNWRKISILLKVLLGIIAIVIIFAIYFYQNDNFIDFWSQTIKYTSTYHISNSLQVQLPNRIQFLITSLVFIPALLMGIFTRGSRHMAFLAILASLGIFTRFEYFHLQPALPFIACLIYQTKISRVLTLFLFLPFFTRFMVSNFNLPARFMTPDIIKSATKASSFVSPGEKTMFVNTWDHFYFLTRTTPVSNFFVSSTPWNLTYPGIQEKLVANLEKERPKYVFMGPCVWQGGICFKPEKIVSFLLTNYRQVSKLPDGTGVFEYYPVGVR